MEEKWWLDPFHANPGSPCFSKLNKAAAIVSPEWDLNPPVVVGLPPIQALHQEKSSILWIVTTVVLKYVELCPTNEW